MRPVSSDAGHCSSLCNRSRDLERASWQGNAQRQGGGGRGRVRGRKDTEGQRYEHARSFTRSEPLRICGSYACWKWCRGQRGRGHASYEEEEKDDSQPDQGPGGAAEGEKVALAVVWRAEARGHGQRLRMQCDLSCARRVGQPCSLSQVSRIPRSACRSRKSRNLSPAIATAIAAYAKFGAVSLLLMHMPQSVRT